MAEVLSLFGDNEPHEPAQEPRESTDEAFDRFWQAYPSCRRERKALAKAKFEAIVNGGLETRTFDRDSNTYFPITLSATPDEIIEGARRYDAKMRRPGKHEFGYRDDGKYVCQPATFLNQGRWLDGL